MNWGLLVSFAITLLAVVGVFADIPFVSEYAFWVLLASYLIFVGFTVENARKAAKTIDELTKKLKEKEKEKK